MVGCLVPFIEFNNIVMTDLMCQTHLYNQSTPKICQSNIYIVLYNFCLALLWFFEHVNILLWLTGTVVEILGAPAL